MTPHSLDLTRRAFLNRSTKVAAASIAASTLPQGLFAEPGGTPLFVSTTATAPWQPGSLRAPGWQWDTLDVSVGDTAAGAPAIRGFGACFNELGWVALSHLSSADRDAVFEELFTPGKGANFALGRMPIGANDFSRGWYSYDETSGDFALAHFSVRNDEDTLIPFIQAALRRNPKLALWASPWSPPSWMKRNNFYAEALNFPGWPVNGIRPDQLGHEGEDMFRQEDPYFSAYAEYFGRFLDAYKQHGIRIGMVMPQNEFNSAQAFPSCTWTPAGLARFLHHLGPAMQRRDAEIFFGTLERGNRGLLDEVMSDQAAAKWIQGVGVQWAAKTALAGIHARYPGLTLYGSEQECGDGKNDWTYAGYCWNLMRHYLTDGASGYLYWNLALEPGGLSHWGWAQNSLLTVDPNTRRAHWNHEYYLLKHASHFIAPGARRLGTDGTFNDLLAFRNPDGSTALVLRNEAAHPRALDVSLGSSKVPLTLPPDSFNSLFVPAP